MVILQNIFPCYLFLELCTTFIWNKKQTANMQQINKSLIQHKLQKQALDEWLNFKVWIFSLTCIFPVLCNRVFHHVKKRKEGVWRVLTYPKIYNKQGCMKSAKSIKINKRIRINEHARSLWQERVFNATFTAYYILDYFLCKRYRLTMHFVKSEKKINEGRGLK